MSPRRSLRVACAVVAALVSASCVPPEDAYIRHPDHTPMGEIQKRGFIRVAMPADSPPFFMGEGEPPTDGFLVDIANEIADDLQVNIEYVVLPPDEVLSRLDIPETSDSEGLDVPESEQVDIAFTLEPITEAKLRTYLFADPYYIGHQRLLVPSTSAVQDVSDLAGETICSVARDDTGISLDELDPSIRVEIATSVEDCLPLLDSGEAAAVTGPDVVLMKLMTERDDLRLAGPDLTTEAYGIAISATTLGGFVGVVSEARLDAIEDGRWADYYREWLTPLTGEAEPEPPSLTAEEAAALWPTKI
jgi:ABC-type amino acid transport substrate-binding protein